MGWDIVPICLGHKVDTSDYKKVAMHFGSLLSADVDCYRESKNDDEWDEEHLEHIKTSNATRKIKLLERPEDGRMKRCFEITIFNSPYSLYEDNSDEDELRIFDEIADFYLCNSPFRWTGFTNCFYEYNWAEIQTALIPYRKKLLKYCNLLGSRDLVYVCDQGVGTYAFDKETECATAKEFRSYIENKGFMVETDEDISEDHFGNSVSIDIPAYLRRETPPISGDKYLDVLYDDFRDLLDA